MYRFLVPLFVISSVFAQSQDEAKPLDDETSMQAVNNFEYLIESKEIVYELRKKYSVKGSVLLTKTLDQILSSFSNQEQAQKNWQAAVNEVDQLNQSQLDPFVNLRFDTGQVLSKYTQGMDLQKYKRSRIGTRLSKNNRTEFLKLNDDLTIYLHLNDIWVGMIDEITKQETIIWQDVFVNSLSMFKQDKVESELIANIDGKVEEVVLKPLSDKDFFKGLYIWHASDGDTKEFVELVKLIESFNSYGNQFHHSILRFTFNKYQQHYLASAISWNEVVYYLYSRKDQLNDQDLETVKKFIEENDVWFLSKEAELSDINKELPEKIEITVHNLKQYYQNDSHYDLNEKGLFNSYQLVEPMLEKYMATPFRQKIRKELEVCLNISKEISPFPQQPIDVKQFNGCIEDITHAAIIEAKSRELAGSLTKVNSKQALDRTLQLPAWQTINILKARVAINGCLDESHQSVNPLEWLLASESLLWFIDRWPAYFAKYPNNNKIQQIIKMGETLENTLDCIEKPKLELLAIELNKIDKAWQNVKTQIKQVVDEFNEQNLTLGSDLDLIGNVDIASNYRVENATIEACDAQQSCGVHAPLNSSRALFGLFPNHLLVADQLKLGQLKLCYDNVGWENRRSASTHLDNPSVANYFGQFSFSIKGYYDDELVFERKLTSKEEYYYLFGENSDEVLSTYCPLSIVGNKISTTLVDGTYGLVPNRLTFLTASRASESNVLTSNWSSGEEWQDQIANSATNSISENELDELSVTIQEAYQSKAKSLQDVIYQALLGNLQDPTEKQQILTDSFTDMNRIKKLFSQMVYITQPDEYMTNDILHGIFFGSDKISDSSTINEYYKNQLNINQLIMSMDENIKINQNKWNNFTPTWSNAYLKNLLYRLKSLQN